MKNKSKAPLNHTKLNNFNEEVQQFVLKENIHRIRIIALVGAIVNIGVTLASLIDSHYGPIFLQSEIYFRLLWIGLSGFYVLVSSKKNFEKYKVVFNHINLMTLAGCLSFAAFISAMPFADHSYLIVFYTCMLLIGTLLYLSNLEMCVITIPSLLIISAIFIIYPESVMHQQSNYINILSVTFFSMIMAYVNYNAKKSQFSAMKIIEAQHQELYALSTIDELTGLSNRRSINQTLDRVIKEAKEFNKPFGVLMIDIDYFKHFNDFYGHLHGDVCLIEVTNVLKRTCESENGFAGRFGGEEFLVILPNKSEQEIVQFAEHICSEVKSLALTHAKSPFGMVTVSVGVSMRTDFANDLSSELIERADKALYRAKAKGRNQVEIQY